MYCMSSGRACLPQGNAVESVSNFVVCVCISGRVQSNIDDDMHGMMQFCHSGKED